MEIADSFKGQPLEGEDRDKWIEPEKTQQLDEEYWCNRVPDLGGYGLRRKRKASSPAASAIRSAKGQLKTTPEPFTEASPHHPFVMEPPVQPTQLTQPLEDPRRLGRNSSDISTGDLADVICILIPSSPAAFEAAHATILAAPQHMLHNDDLEGVTQDDLDLNPAYTAPREIALRISSKVKTPVLGFKFGRDSRYSDILLVKNPHEKTISNVHFKIFVNQQGSLMIQDTSTNGTVVDDRQLKCKDRNGRQLPPREATWALKSGSIICIVGPGKAEIKFVLRIPARGDHENLYEENLRKYLAARGQVAQFASMRESVYGNHWNGGSFYNFTGLLGKGAFATVYRVQTRNEGTVMAAKELDKRKFIKNGVLDLKFDSELKIMERLQHPNIVEYINCHTYKNHIYIIMEFVPFGELAREMERHGALQEAVVQSITVQILSALRYLHRRNIVHRDIKPDNILISSRDPLVVKLSDFGLSKCVKNQETFLKTFCGTLLYCAPEIYPEYSNYARGVAPKRRRLGDPAPRPSPYDQSVDMWSFGAVLFHILCGKAPILGRGDDRGAQMLQNIMTKDVDFSPLRNHGVSEEAIDFISRLMNRNPRLRPNEDACFQHAWIKDVQHPLEYEDNEELHSEDNQPKLEIVEEASEDDEEEAVYEAVRGLEQITGSTNVGKGNLRTRRSKRLRGPDTVASGMGGVEIKYPALPELVDHGPGPGPTGRLFGEIIPSILKSSGVLGQPLASPSQVRDMRNRVERISVNDFVTVTDSNDDQVMAEVPGSAASLLGAEAQIGQLNMASPDAGSEEVSTPDTTNPITPQTRNMSPANISTASYEDQVPTESSSTRMPVFDRRIDLALITDEKAFAASQEARKASRAQKALEKAATFAATSNRRSNSIEMAKTVDARTGQPAKSMTAAHEQTYPRLDRTIRFQTNEFIKPVRRIGKLTSVQGSFTELTIALESRLTSWGRGLDCTVQFPDKKDTRIPKMALKLTFWAPGVEAHLDQGGDWKNYPGIRTLVATSASKSVLVNDVELRRETANGEAALYGKLYSGDVITVYDDGKQSLKLNVEITFGDSARPRPEKEKGFQLQEERHHHQRMKERESIVSRAISLDQEAPKPAST